VAFVVIVLAVLGGAIATIQWYGTSAYFLGVDDGELVLYKGRPGGILWIDPKVVDRTGIDEDDVPGSYSLEQSRTSRRELERSIRNIERDIAATSTTTSTTTTTTTLAVAPPPP
jgi:hypothetical protein